MKAAKDMTVSEMEEFAAKYSRDPLFNLREEIQIKLDKSNSNVNAVSVINNDGSYSIELIKKTDKNE